MASGTIWLSTDGVLTGKIDWSSASNGSVANTSTLTATMYARRTDGYTTYGRGWGGYLYIDGQTTDVYFDSVQYVGSEWAWMASASKTINHNSDGSGSAYIEGAVQGCSGTSLASRYVSGGQSVTLDTIPRATEISSIVAENMDGNITFNVSVKNSAFSHTLKWYIGNREYSRAISFTNNKATIPFTAQSLYYDVDNDNAPLWDADKKTLSVKFSLITKNGNTQIGDAQNKTIDVSLGNAYNPDAPTMEVSQTEAIETKFGAYIQNKSKVRTTLDGTGTTKLNSTISKYSYYFVSASDTEDKTDKTETTNYYEFTPKNSGTYYLYGLIEDSRGLKTLLPTITPETISVIPYGNPVISAFSVERNDSEPKKVNIKLNCSVYSLGENNDKRAVIRYKKLSDGTELTKDVSLHFSLSDDEKYFVIDEVFEFEDTNIDDDSQYKFTIELYDYFTTLPITLPYDLGTAFQLLNFNSAGDGFAVGKVADNNLDHTIEIADNMTMLYHGVEVGTGGGDTLPYGSIVDYDGDSVPSGYEEVPDYSTSEVDTGMKWIDGKKIYRKVFSGTTSTSDATTDFSISDLNVDVPINLRVICAYSNGWLFDGFGNSASSYLHGYVANNSNVIRINQVGFSGQRCYAILEYTKK